MVLLVHVDDAPEVVGRWIEQGVLTFLNMAKVELDDQDPDRRKKIKRFQRYLERLKAELRKEIDKATARAARKAKREAAKLAKASGG